MIAKVSENAANHYRWGEGCEGWRLMQNPEFSVISELMPPGTAELKHFHHKSRQFFFVLSGALEVHSGAVHLQLGSGDGVEISPETVHEIRNDSEHEVRFLVVSHPPTHDDRMLVK